MTPSWKGRNSASQLDFSIGNTPIKVSTFGFGAIGDVWHVGTLVAAAIRFAISKPQVSTALVGISTQEQLEAAV